MVYKLVELDGEGKFKLSPGKKTIPWPSRSFAAETAQAGFAATTSRGPASPPKVSRSWCRSFEQAGWCSCPRWKHPPRCREQLAVVPSDC